jgi:hypothetical protein
MGSWLRIGGGGGSHGVGTHPGIHDRDRGPAMLRNEYLVAENGILKAQPQRRLRLSDAERARLGEIGHRLGREALSEVATAALPETILTWLWGAKWPSADFAVDSRGLGHSANARDRSEGRGASVSRLGYFGGSDAEGVAGRRERVPTAAVGRAAAQAPATRGI